MRLCCNSCKPAPPSFCIASVKIGCMSPSLVRLRNELSVQHLQGGVVERSGRVGEVAW